MVLLTCRRVFNNHKLYILPTLCIYVVCVGLRANSDYSDTSANE